MSGRIVVPVQMWRESRDFFFVVAFGIKFSCGGRGIPDDVFGFYCTVTVKDMNGHEVDCL